MLLKISKITSFWGFSAHSRTLAGGWSLDPLWRLDLYYINVMKLRLYLPGQCYLPTIGSEPAVLLKLIICSLAEENGWMANSWGNSASRKLSLRVYTNQTVKISAELGQESQASPCLRKGTPLASRVAQGVSCPSSSCVCSKYSQSCARKVMNSFITGDWKSPN